MISDLSALKQRRANRRHVTASVLEILLQFRKLPRRPAGVNGRIERFAVILQTYVVTLTALRVDAG